MTQSYEENNYKFIRNQALNTIKKIIPQNENIIDIIYQNIFF